MYEDLDTSAPTWFYSDVSPPPEPRAALHHLRCLAPSLNLGTCEVQAPACCAMACPWPRGPIQLAGGNLVLMCAAFGSRSTRPGTRTTTSARSSAATKHAYHASGSRCRFDLRTRDRL